MILCVQYYLFNLCHNVSSLHSSSIIEAHSEPIMKEVTVVYIYLVY
jgi:hypothetical protein